MLRERSNESEIEKTGLSLEKLKTYFYLVCTSIVIIGALGTVYLEASIMPRVRKEMKVEINEQLGLKAFPLNEGRDLKKDLEYIIKAVDEIREIQVKLLEDSR